MSEPNTTPPSPKTDGGLKPADADAGKTDAAEPRSPANADDIERGDSPGGRDGGMIGEG